MVKPEINSENAKSIQELRNLLLDHVATGRIEHSVGNVIKLFINLKNYQS